MTEQSKRISTETNKLEAKFQDFVDQFDHSFETCGMTTVFEKLGKPEYRKNEDIPDSEISQELERVMKLMYKHNLSADSICGITDREFYRFITEDVFSCEVEDFWVDGLMSNFIYEEFYPNDKHDIEEIATHFIRSFLNRDIGFFSSYLSMEAQENDWFYTFTDTFSKTDLLSFKIIENNIQNKESLVDFYIHFTAEIEDSNKLQTYEGSGSLKLISHHGSWNIQSLKLPEPDTK